MKSANYVLLLFFIKICHRSHASDEPPKDCSQCSFEDTSTIPGTFQCSSKRITDEDEQFLRMIECGMRTHCKIADPCRRVQSIKSSDGKEFRNNTYDFIIVGAGVAGSVLARRLSKDYKVLLLEAGPEEPVGTSVPYFSSSAINTPLDWKYKTEPEANACRNKNGVCDWPRGKMIGGSFSMSNMLYIRGSPEIYNAWGKQGNTGWNYNEALYYFKKSENNSQPIKTDDCKYHGFSGPMPIGNFPHMPRLGHQMLKAAENAGFKIRDLNGANQSGFAVASVMTDHGISASPSRMYLRPVLKRQNLRVLIESHVTKVLFKNNQTNGVEFVDKFKNHRKVFASKEVILAGGTIGSAQLLMLSGIGPKTHLQNMQIQVIKDLPVGRNLHHHVGVEGIARFKNLHEDHFNLKSLELYLQNQTGPFSSTGLSQVSGFWSSSKASPRIPDIQFFLDPYHTMDECFKSEKSSKKMTVAKMKSIYLTTKCRGKIELRSTNPLHHPKIYPNYLCNKTDVDATVEGIRKLQRILKTRALKKYFVSFTASDEYSCHSFAKDSNDYWRCHVRTNTVSGNHAGGSCKMGPARDKTSVVDPELRVHGIKNLRVADASVIPSPINSNSIAPVLMIAEKASDMILNTWSE